ncbi:MAG TPA: thiamine/thiamine pyrophosphate ABC transporter permease ThiP, partial [Paracoccaceae bacterium]|nr:thiamine/thiamine pyrophosphate ABC transporter permease ThiP [Paracoccaceae bacterium]
MARRAVPLGLPAALAAAAVLALLAGPLAAVAWRSGGGGLSLSPADWAALRFTVVQAALSALISVALAVPVAR